MRKGDFKLTFESFEGWMKISQEVLDQVADAPAAAWSRPRKLAVHEAIALRMVADWEVLVEVLMVDCLNRDSSTYAESMGLKLHRHLPWEECQAILHGLGYFSFSNMDDLIGKARRTLSSEWNPFKAIPQRSRKKIGEFITIRNYLAHYSALARRQVDRIYKRTYKMKQFREPGAFLMARPTPSRQRRYMDYFDAFDDATAKMRTALGL